MSQNELIVSGQGLNKSYKKHLLAFGFISMVFKSSGEI